MNFRIAEENCAAGELLTPAALDGSRIGVNYADAYVKAMNVELADGRKVSCKRRGLKLTLIVGERTGEALMRRIEYGPVAQEILRHALEDAAVAAGERFIVHDGVMYFGGGAA